MRLRKISWSILCFSAALWAATAAARAAHALRAGLDALPPDIQTLYNEGQYRQAAEALQAEVERDPKDPALYFWLGRCFIEVRDFSR
jgi:Flp pilus assembly protein TadD